MIPVILFLLASAAFAQSTAGISGSVVDLAGDPVAEAEIHATNVASKAVFTARASAPGAYTFAQLPVGTYELSGAAPGFELFSQTNVAISGGQTLQLNLRFHDMQLNTLGDGRDFFISLDTPHSVPSGPTPRMPDGKPDLSGVWHPQRIVDPGKPEMKPWAEAVLKERAENQGKDFPQSRCLPLGLTLNGWLGVWRTVHTPQFLAMIFEVDILAYRQIYLDGRAHPKEFGPTWNGHSVGHWEEDTLVVDTVGFNDKFWFDGIGHPHTEKLHVTERYRRPDLGHLEVEFTIEDPDTYIRPWVIKRVADLAPQEEIGEYVCTENERDQPHLVGK
jgi:hypothetical protein